MEVYKNLVSMFFMLFPTIKYYHTYVINMHVHCFAVGGS